MIYFDLDGVIRDLSKVTLVYEPSEWYSYQIDGNKDSADYMSIVNNNLNLLVAAPVTEYFKIIKEEVPNITIITCQPESWKKNTQNWIRRHFDEWEVTTIYVSSIEEKLDYLLEEDFLVEDYPFFTDYSRIVLIDKLYNSNVTGEIIRITEPEELRDFLVTQRYNGENNGRA